MRTFEDDQGQSWVADVGEESGGDYKGRYYLTLRLREGDDGDVLPLSEIRWNSRQTAERTVQTMSEWELRRKVRAAVARVS